ncbi:galactose-1-phosphate uridylyltransferase [Pseudonocardia sp.]|jgi:UDPglucose--hexose-1-phosphate uridylyltransferase|uniref:galactose-1-phosphate uridylyltransferase n=1 Tax=Pseudonocardia sp. TaxID=60912 RepID=UPI002605A5F4|nr:galactose-1-phosphate uridylyltransferase [Pseudonocardia sp.]MCW2721481.1 galT [Pseudonocardia sp.]MDT7617132.1 UDPglucose--hexose-phosphate uridylyltransferase [Pseudonocardiales bacterium]
MADGRELFYFDDATVGREVLPDTRDLPVVEHGSTMRFDVLTGEWVTIAAHRMDRTFLPPADHCPLCPTQPGREPSEIPAPDYDVVVFENRFPSFAQTTTQVEPNVDGMALWPQRPATGRCEVVCFTSDHSSSFAALTESRVRTVIEAWADRTAALSAMPGVEQVFPFENRGKEIGVTLDHPHGQIYAYPFVTPRTASLITRAGAHRQRTGRDLMGDVLDAERKAGTRVVLDGEHWTAFVPAAARWPVEAHLVPHRAVPDIAALHEEERAELAVLYRDLLGRLNRYFGEPGDLPYISGWHQAPVHTGRDLTRLHLQLFSLRRAPGKLKYLAGSESGMAAWVNDAAPETIAERLRGAV